MKLNLGSGNYQLERWHADGFRNVDMLALSGVDDVVNLAEFPWPWPDASAEEAYLGHFLEHMLWENRPPVLREVYRILAPGGLVTVVVPDFAEAARGYLEGRYSLDEAAGVVFGYRAGQALGDISEHYWHLHKWGYDAGSLRRLLEDAGFMNLQPVDVLNDPQLVGHDRWQVGWRARKL